jgi:uncharacterized tellurite resistance protein B-like protein
MSKQEAILRYKTSMTAFKKWAADGVISEEELSAIDTIIADKYGVSLSSIYRENELLCAENRANIP